MEMETAAFIAHLQRKLIVSRDEATVLAKELIERFLPIKRYLKDFDATICSPSPWLDEAWHELILFTKLYAKLCGKSFVHHDPLGESDSVHVKAQRYKKTLLAYEELFGAPPSDQHIWPSVYPGSAVTDDDDDDDQSDETSIDNKSTQAANIKESPSKKRKIMEPSDESQCARGLVESKNPQPTSTVTTNPTSPGPVVISFKDQRGESTFFKIFPRIAFRKCFDLMAQRMGVELSQLHFRYNGCRVDPDQTFEESELQDGDVIDVMLGQRGC